MDSDLLDLGHRALVASGRRWSGRIRLRADTVAGGAAGGVAGVVEATAWYSTMTDERNDLLAVDLHAFYLEHRDAGERPDLGRARTLCG
jgi:hypothetical protein